MLTIITSTKQIEADIAAAETDIAANDADIAALLAGKISGFGGWVSKSDNTIYEALTHGVVCAYSLEATAINVKGYTDSNANPATLICHVDGDGAANEIGCITMPVAKGDYWKVVGASVVYWIPLEKV